MSVEALKQAMATRVEDPKNNEDETNKGVNDVRKNPPDRAPGTLDALWGDHPPQDGNQDPDVYGTAAVREARDGRNGLLERIFDSPKSSAPAEQSLMDRLFANMGKSTPHSPLLQRGREIEKVASDESLTDQVNRVVGFR